MKKRKVIPSLLTSLNLLCGFLAILANHPIYSFYLILIGIAFDFLDGFTAKALKVPSEFGKELDSMADMVTFGVAPGFLYHQFIALPILVHTSMEMLAYGLSALIPVLAGLRLARFNVYDSNKVGFSGLPSSAAALFIISLPYIGQMEVAQLDLDPSISLESIFTFDESLLILAPIAIALLMVTNLPLFNFKNIKAGFALNKIQVLYLTSLLIGFWFLKMYILPASIIWYILLSVATIPVWRPKNS